MASEYYIPFIYRLNFVFMADLTPEGKVGMYHVPFSFRTADWK